MNNDKEKILKERAKKLSLQSAEKMNEPFLEVVEFTLGSERHAIEARYIQEVYPLKKLVELPSVPSHVLGLINVRRKIYTVFDLRVFFNLPIEISDSAKVILLEYQGIEFAVFADRVLGASIVKFSDLQPALPTMTGLRLDFLKGITLDGLVILDGQRLLTSQKIVV